MSYTPTEWNTGDVITAEKLNNIESGIVSHDVYIITSTNDDSLNAFVLDKTFGEILQAFKSGKNVIVKLIPDSDPENAIYYCAVLWVLNDGVNRYITILDPRSINRLMVYSAYSVDDFPKFEYE